MSSENEIQNCCLAAYGTIIRGDENTSEDQIAEACDRQAAALLVYRFNGYRLMELALRKLIDKDIVPDEYEGEEREAHITAHLNLLLRNALAAEYS